MNRLFWTCISTVRCFYFDGIIDELYYNIFVSSRSFTMGWNIGHSSPFDKWENCSICILFYLRWFNLKSYFIKKGITKLWQLNPSWILISNYGSSWLFIVCFEEKSEVKKRIQPIRYEANYDGITWFNEICTEISSEAVEGKFHHSQCLHVCKRIHTYIPVWFEFQNKIHGLSPMRNTKEPLICAKYSMKVD